MYAQGNNNKLICKCVREKDQLQMSQDSSQTTLSYNMHPEKIIQLSQSRERLWSERKNVTQSCFYVP